MSAWIGTSGFQYPEWKAKFYPADLPTRKMLEHYSETFNSTESNYTFRRIPAASTLEQWASRTPKEFRFSLKAPQQITHLRKLRECESIVSAFWKAAEPLGPKFGAVLFQLPPSMPEDLALLSDFLEMLPLAMKAAFEFRHESWFQDKVFAALKKRNAALCIAESEDLAVPVEFTASFAYYRLRKVPYEQKKICEWAGIIGQQPAQVKTTFVYFKHEEMAFGPKAAMMLKEALSR